MNQSDIDKYLSTRMTPAEAEAFEEYCVAHPQFAKQVEFEQRLKAGIVSVGSRDNEEFVRSRRGRAWYAAAAVVVLGAGALFAAWYFAPGPHRPLLADAAGAARDGVVTMRLALVRGADTAPALPAGLVRVDIAGLFDPQMHYTVALDRLEEGHPVETLATLRGQHPLSPVSLDVLIDGDQLAVGRYALRIQRQTSDEEPLDFGFVKN